MGGAGRLGVLLCIIALAGLVLLAPARPAMAGDAVTYDIQPQRLGAALKSLAEQGQLQMMFSPQMVAGLVTKGLKGTYPPARAIKILLEGTGLAFHFNGRDTIVISRSSAGKKEDSVPPEAGSGPSGQSEPAGTPGGAREVPAASGQGASESAIEEILVTAARREQRLQDVAGGIQVFTGAELDRLGAESFQDYLLQVPGLSYRDQGSGAKRIAIRGVSNIAGSDFGVTNSVSTVGVYLNDVPIQGTSVLPDLSLYDLNRIEVLKGPQGTLYGEGAMGGAIKMILNAPDLGKTSFKGDSQLSSTKSGGANYRLRGAVNLPLITDRVALRAVATYRNNEGFVDNVFKGTRNINDDRKYSIRGVLFAQLTDTLSLEVMALHDSLKQNDFPEVQKALGDLKISSAETRRNKINFTLLGLTTRLDLGFAELTSVTSYYKYKRNWLMRFPFAKAAFGMFGTVTQEPFDFNNDLDSFAEEARLVSQGDKRLDWVFGVFYRDKDNQALGNAFFVPGELASVNAGLAAFGLPPFPADGIFLNRDTVDSFQQIAVYGEATLELGPGLEVMAGLRWFNEDVGINDKVTLFGIMAPGSSPRRIEKVSDKGVVPKLGISYKVSEDHLVYAQASKGFRSGGINLNAAFGVGALAYESDSLWNFEVGAKTAWNDGRLIVNGSAYYLDWNNIQTNQVAFSPVLGAPASFLGNGGDARILGFELQVAALPVEPVSLGFTLGYNDSKLTRATSDATPGADLPNVPQWTASAYSEYRFPAGNFGDGFIRFDFQFVDKQLTRLITATSDGFGVRSFTLGNLRIGVRGERIGAFVFVDNLWDTRAELGRGMASVTAFNDDDRVIVARPRTIGISVQGTF
jgi:outer membrane receptor protein involved in Fe transport